MDFYRYFKKTMGATVLVAGFLMLLGCSGIFAVDDECNIDRDCGLIAENLRCESHLCVAADTDSESDADADSDDDSDDDSESAPENDSASDDDSSGTDDTETGPASPTVLYRYTFTDGLEGFVGPGFTHNAENGTAEISWTFETSNESVDFERSYGRADWSDVVEIDVRLVVDSFISGGVNLYIKSAAEWEYCSTWYDFPLLFEMTTVPIYPEYCDGQTDMSVLRSIGIQLHSGNMPVGHQEVHMEIDEIVVKHIAP